MTNDRQKRFVEEDPEGTFVFETKKENRPRERKERREDRKIPRG